MPGDGVGSDSPLPGDLADLLTTLDIKLLQSCSAFTDCLNTAKQEKAEVRENAELKLEKVAGAEVGEKRGDQGDPDYRDTMDDFLGAGYSDCLKVRGILPSSNDVG